jgi:3-oxoacyl-[acyl-carrier protein] reductase
MERKQAAALVTGAAAGIGRAAALRLAADGCSVAATDIQPDRLRETASMITDAGGRCLAVVADMSQSGDIDRMVDEAASFLGGIDILVNNAGVGSIGFMEQITDDEIARVFGVNLFGVMRVIRAAVPYLKKSGRGRIINIASVEGIRGSGLLATYSSTKAGVIGLTKANAIELGRFGVTANAICPGPIQTEMLAPLIADPKTREKFIKGIAMRRLGVPEDVAHAISFLASEEASFITGQVLVVDGGMTVKSL